MSHLRKSIYKYIWGIRVVFLKRTSGKYWFFKSAVWEKYFFKIILLYFLAIIYNHILWESYSNSSVPTQENGIQWIMQPYAQTKSSNIMQVQGMGTSVCLCHLWKLYRTHLRKISKIFIGEKSLFFSPLLHYTTLNI